ncbi:Ttn [Symbiodinium microadriaticum]|nr:Ttn [Symbiodinium microadriaticum]
MSASVSISVSRSRAFYIQAKDTADNLLKSNQEVFQVTFNGPVTFTVVSAPVNPDAMDGLYKVEYLVNRAGNYRLSVALNGMPIKDSPFEFVARPGRVASEWSTVQGLAGARVEQKRMQKRSLQPVRRAPRQGSIEFTAGTESEFVVQAKDAYGNALDEEARAGARWVAATWRSSGPEVGEVTASIEWENYDSLTAAWLQKTCPAAFDSASASGQICLWMLAVLTVSAISDHDRPGRHAAEQRRIREAVCVAGVLGADFGVCQVLLRESQLHRIWPAMDSGPCRFRPEHKFPLPADQHHRYDIKYTALREGTHKLFVKINGGNVYLSPFTLRGSPAAAPYGPKSLAESGQPPASGVAGDEIVFHVQLRDAYGNLLASSPAGAIVVRVSSAPPVSQAWAPWTREPGAQKVTGLRASGPPSCAPREVCSPSTGGSTGLYECRITPTVSGERSVQVDGVEISKLEMVQQLTVTQGPFALFVEPAAVSPANTAVYNVQSSYLAGATVDALVQLRDRFGNNRTSSSATLLFQGRFGPSILAFTDNNDGTVTVKVGTHLAGEHPLQITLAGVQISNTPTPEIPVLSSIARFDGTDCAIPAEIIAGIQHPFQCVPRDTFGNKVVDNNLFIQAEFVNMDDSSAPVITVDGTYSLVDDNYDFPLEIDKVGAYSVVTQLWARGGLIGRYYRTPGFQSLVSLLTDRPHQGLALFEYTRVRDSGESAGSLAAPSRL